MGTEGDALYGPGIQGVIAPERVAEAMANYEVSTTHQTGGPIASEMASVAIA